MADQLIGIANHDPVLIRLLSTVLEDAGYRTLHLPQGSAAYEEIKKSQPDLIVLDTWLENREAGWQLFQVLRLDPETKEIPVLICSSDLAEFEKRATALEEHGHVGVLHKPFDIDVLVRSVKRLLEGEVVWPSPDGARPRIDPKPR
jgi:CheY-like chemotaxis protein